VKNSSTVIKTNIFSTLNTLWKTSKYLILNLIYEQIKPIIQPNQIVFNRIQYFAVPDPKINFVFK